MRLVWVVVLAATLLAASPGVNARQAYEDDYVRYDLGQPGTGEVRVTRELAVTTPGATTFFAPVRPGTAPAGVVATALAAGQPLRAMLLSGAEARRNGHPDATLDVPWLRVELAQPVPKGGEVRLRLEYTERDGTAGSSASALSFSRPPGPARGSVVLPAGFRVVSCNIPVQVHATPEGRVMVSFLQTGPAPAALEVRARAGLAPFTPAWPTTRGAASQSSLASQAARLGERAYQDREIVYFMNDPATNSFDLYHDYTETRPGVGNYFNVVRAGSRASNPSAISLDSGEALKVETLTGDEVTRRGLNVGENVGPETEVVVISFPPVEAGRSTRLRISETYTDPGRYYLEGDELVWDRGFGRAKNDVVLPPGYTAVASAIPGVISEEPDGRQRVAFLNNRPDEIQVLIRARKVR